MKFLQGLEATQRPEVNCVIYLANDHNANRKTKKRRWKKIHSLTRKFIEGLELGNREHSVGLKGVFIIIFHLMQTLCSTNTR